MGTVGSRAKGVRREDVMAETFRVPARHQYRPIRRTRGERSRARNHVRGVRVNGRRARQTPRPRHRQLLPHRTAPFTGVVTGENRIKTCSPRARFRAHHHAGYMRRETGLKAKQNMPFEACTSPKQKPARAAAPRLLRLHIRSVVVSLLTRREQPPVSCSLGARASEVTASRCPQSQPHFTPQPAVRPVVLSSGVTVTPSARPGSVRQTRFSAEPSMALRADPVHRSHGHRSPVSQ